MFHNIRSQIDRQGCNVATVVQEQPIYKLTINQETIESKNKDKFMQLCDVYTEMQKLIKDINK
jgi:hypothetical protein